MYKFIAAVHRRGDLTREQFRDHYSNRHGPLIEASTGFRRHLLKYIQHETVTPQRGPAFLTSGPDCLSALYFHDSNSFNAAFNEPDYAGPIREDESRFISFDSLILGAAFEVFLKTPPPTECQSNKLLIYRKPSNGMNTTEFNDHWLSTQAPKLAKDAEFEKTVRGYVVNQFLLPSLTVDIEFLLERQQFAMLEELWFDSEEASVAYYNKLHEEGFLMQDQTVEGVPDAMVMFVRERQIF
jgi:hypothetical protein